LFSTQLNSLQLQLLERLQLLVQLLDTLQLMMKLLA